MDRSEIYENFARMLGGMEVFIPDEGLLAGPVRPVREALQSGGFVRYGIGWDNAHFPLNYGLLMREGVSGVIRRATAPAEGLSPEMAENRRLIADCWRLISDYIRRHGREAARRAAQYPEDAARLARISGNCLAIADHAPESFEQGVQLFWFIWRMRAFFTSSIGRMDVHLYPLYRRDVPERLSREAALDLLVELFGRLTAVYSGDTLMNLMVGGTDEDGRDSTNDLSLLIIEASIHAPGSEPHINIRLHADSPEALYDAAARMIADGRGQGVLYYDRNIIPDLVRRGLTIEQARSYANDGCTELTFDAHAGIWFWQMESMKTLELSLFRGCESPCAPHSEYRKWAVFQPARLFRSNLIMGYDAGDPCDCADFEDLMALFLRQFRYQINGMLNTISREIASHRAPDGPITSPIVAGLVERTLDTGVDPMRGGWDVMNYQLLSGSLPTTADALYGIRRAVYDDHFCTMPELLDALRTNFERNEPLRAYLKRLPKFGNDCDDVDQLAARLVDVFCTCVENYADPNGVSILPGIYNIDFHMFSSALGASPDGRRAGDPICAHYSPTPGCAQNGPTAVIASAAKAALHRGCASSPLYISLPRAVGALGLDHIRTLIDICGEAGLPVVSLSVYNKALLEDARIHPEKHEDLIVRVWGFNARFIDLDADLQDHIIGRIL